jgi:hypothetical protein
MKGLLVLLVFLFHALPALADGAWDKPAVDPYMTEVERRDPAVRERKVHLAVDDAVSEGLIPTELAERFKLMGVSVLAGEEVSGCKEDTLAPGLLLARMASKKHFLSNMTVGDWVSKGSLQPGAWTCAVQQGNTTYYMVIPKICYNVSFVILQNGECVPNKHCPDCGKKTDQIVNLGEGVQKHSFDLFLRADSNRLSERGYPLSS